MWKSWNVEEMMRQGGGAEKGEPGDARRGKEDDEAWRSRH
jgi:hypothetical protein